MELLDRETFLEWMERIMKRFDDLKRTTPDIPQRPMINSEPLLDNQEVCLMLQISKRTLQRYRSEGALAYKTLGKKTYYSETDVLDFLSKHVKDFRQNDIEFYKARIRNLFNK